MAATTNFLVPVTVPTYTGLTSVVAGVTTGISGDVVGASQQAAALGNLVKTIDAKVMGFNPQTYTTAGRLDSTSGNDDAAILATINDCMANKGKLVLAPRPDGTLRITQPLVYKPVNTDSEIYADISGGARLQVLSLPAGAAALSLLGLRGSNLDNVRINMPRDANVNGIAGLDIDTRTASGTGGVNQSSATGLNFKGGGVFLGSGANNVGVRLGKVSGGGGDVSGLTFQNFNINSAADNGSGAHTGATNAISGQTGMQNLGRNTLNIMVDTCTWAYLDKGYDNSSGGNGAITFNNMTTSHCKIDYKIGSVQNYVFTGCRSEDSLQAFVATDGIDSPTVLFQNCLWDNLIGDSNGIGFFFGRPGSYQFIGGAINNSYTSYGPSLMRFNSYSTQPSQSSGDGYTAARQGLFRAIGLSVQGNPNVDFYSIEGGNIPRYRVRVDACPILNAQNLIQGYYNDRSTN